MASLQSSYFFKLENCKFWSFLGEISFRHYQPYSPNWKLKVLFLRCPPKPFQWWWNYQGILFFCPWPQILNFACQIEKVFLKIPIYEQYSEVHSDWLVMNSINPNRLGQICKRGKEKGGMEIKSKFTPGSIWGPSTPEVQALYLTTTRCQWASVNIARNMNLRLMTSSKTLHARAIIIYSISIWSFNAK